MKIMRYSQQAIIKSKKEVEWQTVEAKPDLTEWENQVANLKDEDDVPDMPPNEVVDYIDESSISYEDLGNLEGDEIIQMVNKLKTEEEGYIKLKCSLNAVGDKVWIKRLKLVE